MILLYFLIFFVVMVDGSEDDRAKTNLLSMPNDILSTIFVQYCKKNPNYRHENITCFHAYLQPEFNKSFKVVCPAWAFANKRLYEWFNNERHLKNGKYVIIKYLLPYFFQPPGVNPYCSISKITCFFSDIAHSTKNSPEMMISIQELIALYEKKMQKYTSVIDNCKKVNEQCELIFNNSYLLNNSFISLKHKIKNLKSSIVSINNEIQKEKDELSILDKDKFSRAISLLEESICSKEISFIDLSATYELCEEGLRNFASYNINTISKLLKKDNPQIMNISFSLIKNLLYVKQNNQSDKINEAKSIFFKLFAFHMIANAINTEKHKKLLNLIRNRQEFELSWTKMINMEESFPNLSFIFKNDNNDNDTVPTKQTSLNLFIDSLLFLLRESSYYDLLHYVLCKNTVLYLTPRDGIIQNYFGPKTLMRNFEKSFNNYLLLNTIHSIHSTIKSQYDLFSILSFLNRIPIANTVNVQFNALHLLKPSDLLEANKRIKNPYRIIFKINILNMKKCYKIIDTWLLDFNAKEIRDVTHLKIITQPGLKKVIEKSIDYRLLYKSIIKNHFNLSIKPEICFFYALSPYLATLMFTFVAFNFSSLGMGMKLNFFFGSISALSQVSSRAYSDNMLRYNDYIPKYNHSMLIAKIFQYIFISVFIWNILQSKHIPSIIIIMFMFIHYYYKNERSLSRELMRIFLQCIKNKSFRIPNITVEVEELNQ